MAKKHSDDSQASAAVMEDQFAAWKDIRSGLHLIPIGLVVESEDNARKHFDDEELGRLAASIAADGGVNAEAAIVHPLDHDLLKVEDSNALGLGPLPLYELDTGHRRFRALQLNGAQFIKAEIQIHESDAARKRRGLVSNLHRVDLNPMEKSDALQAMLPDYKTVEHLAKAVGINSRTVQDLLNLQRLIFTVKMALIEDRISLSHAVLISRELETDQNKCLDACFRPEAIDNGAGIEMVPKLVSEKQLRDWIRDNLRVQMPETPKLFGTEAEQKEEAQNAATEKEADRILDDSPQPDVGQSNVGSEPVHGDAGVHDESDISDDDLTPEQTAQVKPDDGEYEKAVAARLDDLRNAVYRIKVPFPIAVYKLICMTLLNTMSANKAALVARVFNLAEWERYDCNQLRTLINCWDEKSLNGMTLAAKYAVAMCLINEVNPNGGENEITQALLRQLDNVGREERKTEKHIKSMIKRLPKDEPAPKPSEVSKVMKAEKKKLEKKSAAKSKPKTKAKKR